MGSKKNSWRSHCPGRHVVRQHLHATGAVRARGTREGGAGCCADRGGGSEGGRGHGMYQQKVVGGTGATGKGTVTDRALAHADTGHHAYDARREKAGKAERGR